MSKKSDAKTPDIVQKELQTAFQWSANHSKLVLGITAVLLLAGGGWAVYDYNKKQTEIKLQSEYFKIEKQYLDKKGKFEQAENDAKNPPTKDPKNPEDKSTKAVKASGDLTQDYGDVVTNLKSFVQKNPKSVSAKMAALNLTEVLKKYQKTDEAMEVLKTVNDSSTNLVSGLVKDQLATLHADKNDCSAAIGLWNEISKAKSLDYLSSSVKLKTALCYEAINDLNNARATLNEIKQKNPGSVAAKTAEKYLMLLQDANVKTN